MKIAYGKMAEYMELREKFMAIATRLGCPRMRCYRSLSGGGDAIRGLVCEAEWDSLAALEAYFEKTSTDPEWQALMPKWEEVIESHQLEFLIPMP